MPTSTTCTSGRPGRRGRSSTRQPKSPTRARPPERAPDSRGNDKVGEGRMTVVESRPAELVDIKVDFTRPFAGSNSSTFTFKPDGAGTAVTWSMSGHQNFVEKAVCLVMNGKKMIGDQLDKGLTQLKSVAEKR
ncbi:MAG: SRPBCC family protein [Hyphomicrobium sp.]